MLDAILDAPGFEGLAAGSLLVCLVGVDRLLVAKDEIVRHFALIGLCAGQPASPDQARSLIDRDVRLVAEEQPPFRALPCPVGVGVVR